MDPLGSKPAIVDSDKLPKWSSTRTPRYQETDEERISKFPFNENINNKVVLWAGDITLLSTTAIVHSTNETLTDRNPVSDRIHRTAGPELRDECRTQLIGCRTGEAKITKGYNLPARYVIHTVGPRYNTKYKTAAESALYSCYRNVMQLLREYKLPTIGLSVINSPRRGYPAEEGAHIALRTIRRFLEKYGDAIDTVVFVVDVTDEPIYKRLMPLYYPRNKAEEQHAIDVLPDDIGNEHGEPVIAERKIRIMEKITHSDGEEEVEEEPPDAVSMLESPGVGHHAFAAMAGDHDAMTRQRLQARPPEEIHALEQTRIYQRWLRRARTEDFSDLAKRRFIYQSGVDFLGRAVVVFVGRHFPASTIDLNKAVAYFINVMDHIANKEFVIVYYHTLTTDDNLPTMTFLKDVYYLLDKKYHRNLRAFYVVHPSLWTRLTTWFFTTFTATDIKERLAHLSGVQYLFDKINPDQLDIPPFVLEYDLRMNGSNYYTPAITYRAGML